MSQMIQWLEAHDKLAGWAQFLGAVLALLLTYLTAFVPLWRRKRQAQDWYMFPTASPESDGYVMALDFATSGPIRRR